MFWYFQIRHYITSHKDWNTIKNAPTNVETYFINIIKHQLRNKKLVSHIYRNLSLNTPDNTFYIKNNWELELNIIIEDGEWETMCVGCHKGVNSNMWRAFDWKMKTRFFKTPSVISKFVDESEIDLPFTPSRFVFDPTPEDMYTRDQTYLVHILLLTARKMVTIKWMNSRPPTGAQCKQKLGEVYGMEALTAQLQLRSDVFLRRWLPVARYLFN